MRDNETLVNVKSEPMRDMVEKHYTLGIKSESGTPHPEVLTDTHRMGSGYSTSSVDSEKQDSTNSSNSKTSFGNGKQTSTHSAKSKLADAGGLYQLQAAAISDVEMSIHIKSEPVSDSETIEDVRSGPVTARHGSEEAVAITNSHTHAGLVSKPARDVKTCDSAFVVSGEPQAVHSREKLNSSSSSSQITAEYMDSNLHTVENPSESVASSSRETSIHMKPGASADGNSSVINIIKSEPVSNWEVQLS